MISRRLIVSIAAALLALGTRAQAQVRVGAEVSRDRSIWHFDSPSAIDTTELVPHFFEQRYTLDNLWLTASAVYRAGVDWRTSGGITPVREASATDYDTFFDPGGVTWVAGTSGDARMHSLRLSQEVDLGRRGAVTFAGGYRLHLDLADFLEGDRTETRNGVLVSRTTVSTREYTNAQTHELYVGIRGRRALNAAWELRLTGDIAPSAINRLAIQLPDKYPGQTLVFRTTTGRAGGRVELTHGRGGWPVSLIADVGGSWKYHADQWATRTTVAGGVSIGRSW